MSNQAKYIGTFRFRTKTTDGELAKVVCQLYDNGSVEIKQFFLSNNKLDTDPSLVCTKFNKHLYIRYIFFKFSTLHTIMNSVKHGLIKKEIPIENIL